MKKPSPALNYPVVLRQHMNFITISVPDLNITLIEDLPPNLSLNKDYVTRIGLKAPKPGSDRKYAETLNIP